jgi:hypothetical protein
VKGVDIPEATVPESFKVLVRELNSLSLSIDAKGEVVKAPESLKEDGDAGELAKAAGAEVVVTEELLKDEGKMEVEEVKTK